jgi:hypothetical protein
VDFHENRRLRRGQTSANSLKPEQAGATHSLALEWRDAWRTEAATRDANGTAAVKEPAKARRSDTARFATAIARSEFGRFYWSGALAGQLAKAMEGGPRPRHTSKYKRAGS